MNLIDRIYKTLSPSLYAKRMEGYLRAELMQEQARAYQGATNGRRGRGFSTYGENDPNLVVGMALAQLRDRSRALYNNNPYAKKAINTIALNVVGKGIRPAPITESKTESDAVKSLWREFSKAKNCDFNGRKSIYALQLQAMRTVAMSGECLILKRRDRKGLMPFKLQILEADQLDINKNSIGVNAVKRLANADNYTVQGVEFDKDGRRVAYWIYDSPASDTWRRQFESKRIPASEVIHLYEEIRPGQVRGVPFLSSAMLRLKDFDDYEDSQLMRQKIAACFSVFVTQTPSATNLGSAEEELLEKVEPGIIQHLSPGEQVSFASPPPAEGYDEYTRRVLQGISAGLGLSYESMTGDLKNTNFSSGRMGWIESWKQAEDWQYNLFIPLFCDTVWEWFMESAVMKGYLMKEYDSEWTPQGRYMIDPAKEVKGIVAGIASGLTSWQEAVRRAGYDPETTLEQISEDKERLESLGIKFDWSHSEEKEEDEREE